MILETLTLFAQSQMVEQTAQEANPYIAWLLVQYASYPWINLLLMMMVVDILSGLATSVAEKQLSSKTSYRGMMKKTSILLVIGMAAIIEQTVHTSIPLEFQGKKITLPLAQFVATFFLIGEALSILENAKRAGVPLPSWLGKSLRDTYDKLGKYSSGEGTQSFHIEVKDAKIDAVTKTDNQTPTEK